MGRLLPLALKNGPERQPILAQMIIGVPDKAHDARCVRSRRALLGREMGVEKKGVRRLKKEKCYFSMRISNGMGDA